MTVRRRSRRRPLTELASRLPLHAFGVWLPQSALVAIMFFAAWLLVTNRAAPALVDGFSR